MKSFIAAVKFLWSFQHSQGSPALPDRQLEFSVAAQQTKTDEYFPFRRERGTIVVIHGMSPRGKADPRIRTLSKALAVNGYRVFAPEINSIKALKFCASQQRTIQEILQTIANCRSHAPSGRIAVIAPSFSGGLSLSALVEEKLQMRVAAICMIGSFADTESVMKQLLLDQQSDRYGMLVLLRNIVPLVLDEHGYLIEYLDNAINENLSSTRPAELPEVPLCYSQEQQATIRRLLHDGAFRLSLFKVARKHMEYEMRACNAIERVADLKSRVLLLHGAEDRVIAPRHSQQLHRALARAQVTSRLVVSSLLSHGDAELKFGHLREIFGLVRGFTFFFRSIHANE